MVRVVITRGIAVRITVIRGHLYRLKASGEIRTCGNLEPLARHSLIPAVEHDVGIHRGRGAAHRGRRNAVRRHPGGVIEYLTRVCKAGIADNGAILGHKLKTAARAAQFARRGDNRVHLGVEVRQGQQP